MTADTLTGYGFTPVATVRMVGDRFTIQVTDEETVKLAKCVYVFLVGGEIKRFGSSKAVLLHRFKSWERDVSNALAGRRSSTGEQEGKDWRDMLNEHGGGVIYARQGTEVTTKVGTFNAYLDEESLLIGRHRPPMNGSMHR